MIQRGEDAGLRARTGRGDRVGRQAVRQDLDGDVAIQLRVARAIDLAHAPGPEGGNDGVGAERVTGGETHALLR